MALTYGQISAITTNKIIPKAVDNIFKSIPLMSRMKKKMKLEDGGLQIQQPLNYAQASAVQWYQGADTLDTSDNEVITAAVFDWAQIHATVSVTRRDELKNMGDSGKLNFVKTKVEIAEKSIRDTIATALFNSGTDPKAIVGARTFGSTSNTYGGLSQSTYSWWQSNVDSTTTTLSLSAMQSSWGSASINGEPPSVVICTQANYDRVYALLQPQQRFMDSETADAGFSTLQFNGVPLIADSKCPTGYIFYFNEDYLELYMHKAENFRFEDFAKPINQNVQVAHIYAAMVFASSNNRMHAVMSGITA